MDDARIVERDRTLFPGWCPDCDLQSAVVELDADGTGWATCTECETGWVWRDEAPGESLEWRASFAHRSAA
jgi:hypothetical protein